MLKLQNPYISVLYKSGASFGGSQRLSGNKLISSSGCGVIAAADMLIYLDKNRGHNIETFREIISQDGTIDPESYANTVKYLIKHYFPLIPRFGMNGLGLMCGMQLFFKINNLPYSCYWYIREKGMWDRIEEMLSDDIPVILSVGPNFPFVWRNGKTILYTQNEAGDYVQTSSVKAHFVTVTGMDESWLEISSWGKRYYINKKMYEDYVSQYSMSLVSNILYVKYKA